MMGLLGGRALAGLESSAFHVHFYEKCPHRFVFGHLLAGSHAHIWMDFCRLLAKLESRAGTRHPQPSEAGGPVHV